MRKAIQTGAWAGAIILLALTALPCPAADSAVLRNGFSIRHERRQVIGAITRLYMGADESSFVDVPTVEIDHIEELPVEAAAESAKDAPDSASKLQAVAKKIAQPVDLNEVVNAASGTYRLDPDLVNSVIRAESGFNVHAVSPKGAQGLMQLMPKTASELGVVNAFDPQANVEGGTRYLRELLERYDFDLVKALAAYNAGPQRVEQYGGVPPYYETRAYVARIVRDFNKKKAAQQNEAAALTAKSPAEKRAVAKSSSTAAKTKSSPLVKAKVSTAQNSE